MPSLKAENDRLLLQVAAQSKTQGWQYVKTGTVFQKQVCNGITLQFLPNFTYTSGGMIAVSQPRLYLRSRAFEAQARRIFGFATQGPFLLELGRASKSLAGLPEAYKDRFAEKRVQFLKVETTAFNSHKGYFENDELPFFIQGLLTYSDQFLTGYSRDTELDLLRAMPQAYSPDGPYGATRLGTVTPFALTQLLLGRSDVLLTLHGDSRCGIVPAEARLLATLEQSVGDIAALI
jgi:hypothetical protein